MKTAIILLALLCAGCEKTTDPNSTGRKLQPALFEDQTTGCQYLAMGQGAWARIAADGKTHMGCRGAK